MSTVFTYASAGVIFIIGLGLGASTTVADFKAAAAKPKAVGVGFASQYLFMPLMAFIFASIFDLDDPLAVGLILTGASPGGKSNKSMIEWFISLYCWCLVSCGVMY